MGSFEKLVNSSVHETRDEVLRTIVALCSIVKGEAFTPYNLGVKRPLPGKKGADPIYLDNMIGKVSNRDFSTDEPVGIEDIK
jgi:sialic acid synthase SpsE